MSLKAFHVLFITLSSLLALGFGVWCLRAPALGGTMSRSASAAAAFVVAAGLIAYGIWFLRKIRTREEEEQRRRKRLRPLPVAAAAWLLANQQILACPVCYGDAVGPMIDGARAGVWLLGGLVLSVQLVFAFFFFQLWRRARKQQKRRPRHVWAEQR